MRITDGNLEQYMHIEKLRRGTESFYGEDGRGFDIYCILKDLLSKGYEISNLDQSIKDENGIPMNDYSFRYLIQHKDVYIIIEMAWSCRLVENSQVTDPGAMTLISKMCREIFELFNDELDRLKNELMKKRKENQQEYEESLKTECYVSPVEIDSVSL